MYLVIQILQLPKRKKLQHVMNEATDVQES